MTKKFLGSTDGLTIIHDDGEQQRIANNFNTGVIPVGVKGAWLSDATAGTSVEISSTTNGAVDISQTTITAVSTSGFSATGTICIDNEAISYTGVTGTDFTGCTRGANNSTAATHLTAATVYAFTIEDRSNNGPF